MAEIVGFGQNKPESFMPLNLPDHVVSSLRESACAKKAPEWRQFLGIVRSRGITLSEEVVRRSWLDLRRDGLVGASVEEAVDYLRAQQRSYFGALHDAGPVDSAWEDNGGTNAVQTGLDRPVNTTTTQWEKSMD